MWYVYTHTQTHTHTCTHTHTHTHNGKLLNYRKEWNNTMDGERDYHTKSNKERQILHHITYMWSQETPGVTGKFGLGIQNEAGQRLIEFCQENGLVIANTLFKQHKRRLYTWTPPDGQHQDQTDYILCSQRWRSSIQSTTRPGADCGSDHELLITKFRLKLKKVGKTTRPFRYAMLYYAMLC